MAQRSNDGIGTPRWGQGAPRARKFDWDPIRGLHQGQRSRAPRKTGRTHDRTRPRARTRENHLAPAGPSTHDPKGQTISYTYDDGNRPLTENYTGAAGTEIQYGYDFCDEGIARLCAATTTDVVTKYNYNALGLIADEERTILGATHTTGWSYDRQGNIAAISHPNGGETRYERNDAGQLERIEHKDASAASYSRVIEDLDYSPLGTVSYKRFANGVETHYTLDPNQLYRLVNITTVAPTGEMEGMSGGGGEGAFALDSLEIEGPALSTKSGIEFIKAALLDQGVAHSESPDGSIELAEPREQASRRTASSRTFLLGYTPEGAQIHRGLYYGGHIHYRDPATGDYEEIDTTLVATVDGWSMNKADYGARVKDSLEDAFVTFTNAGQELSFSLPTYPEATRAAARTTDGEWAEKEARYDDALGPGIGLAIKANNEALIKEAVIDNFEALGDLTGRETYDLKFKVSANRQIELRAEGKLLGEQTLTSSGYAEISDDQGDTSYIWPAIAEDSSRRPEGVIPVPITYEFEPDGSILLTKHLPVSWLRKATYPVRTDATVSYYAGSGDGDVWHNDGFTNWDTVHDAESTPREPGTGHWSTTAMTRISAGGAYAIARSFIPIDTSGIPDNATVDAATLYIMPSARTTADNDAYTYIQPIGPATQSSTTTLTAADYDQAGAVHNPTVWSNTKNNYNDTWINGTYVGFPFNSNGIAGISTTSTTKLAMREGHDIEDIAPTAGQNGWSFYTSEETGTSKDPYLEITYTVNSAPAEPTDLLTEGEINPARVTDRTPEFSAVYNDPDEGDVATHYRIQVGTSSESWDNLMWDSGKTAFTSYVIEGNRTEDISYGSTSPLALDGATYYWRIKLWDAYGVEGVWSTTTASFTMASSTLLLQDLTYTYDPVGNITRIVDASETDAAKTVDFEYDPLHRLTRASSTNAANGSDFLRTYAYDPLGNITSKSDQGSYLYQGDQGASYANPHAVTSIGAQTITYDNNGNLLTDGSHTNIWDYRNRLATSTVGATSTGFAYDHENQRVKLYDGSATTIYPNRLYNVRGATTTIHIFDDQGQLIATIEGNGAATSTYYVHTDHPWRLERCLQRSRGAGPAPGLLSLRCPPPERAGRRLRRAEEVHGA